MIDTRYHPTETEVLALLDKLPEPKPSFEEARLFLQLYASGELDGLGVEEITAKLVLANDRAEAQSQAMSVLGVNLAKAIRDPWARRTATTFTSTQHTRKTSKRRAKNRVAKQSRKQNRGKNG